MEMPGEKLLTAMWETLTRGGIGSLLAPWQTRRLGRAAAEAKADEMLLLARAQREVQKILSFEPANFVALELSRSAGEPNLLPVVQEADRIGDFALRDASIRGPLEERIQRSGRADALRKEINVASSILEAEQGLVDGGATDESRPPDDDWLHRWRDHAAGAGQDQFRKLWGAVLAGETRTPGFFSYRTMDFLKNLSLEEAQDLELLAACVVEGFVMPRLFKVIPETGLSFENLMTLQNIGVLQGVNGMGVNRFWNPKEGKALELALCCQEKSIFVHANDAAKSLVIGGVAMVTTIGCDVLKLCTTRANDAYLRNLAEQIKGMGFTVHYGTYTKNSDGAFELPDASEI